MIRSTNNLPKGFTLKLYNAKILSTGFYYLNIRSEWGMNKKIRTEAVDSLFEAILTLESKEECYSFFEDLCTVNELLSLSQRFEVATMLRRHDTYLRIAEKTGASTATISRVNRSLNYGDDGYALVFSRMNSMKDFIELEKKTGKAGE